jgi:hypothetical protein
LVEIEKSFADELIKVGFAELVWVLNQLTYKY